MARLRNTFLRVIERRPEASPFRGVYPVACDASRHARSGERMRTCHGTAYGLVVTSRSSAASAVQEVNGWRTRVVPRPLAATRRVDHPLVSDLVVTIMAWSLHREWRHNRA